MAIPYHLTIDIKQDWDSPYKLPRVTQNDTDIEFIITVKDGGQDVNVAERYSTITMTSQRPDRMAFYILGNVNEETGKVHFVLGSKEVEFVGRVNASVQLYSVDGRQSTAHFAYSVRGDLSKQMVPTEKESTLIEQVLVDGPRIISEAEKAALDSIASLEDFNQEKAAALIELGEIKDSNRVIFRQPVNTFADLATTYPNPEHGTTVRVTGESATYRYSDGSWVKTDEYNPTAIDQVTAQLAEKAKQIVKSKALKDATSTVRTRKPLVTFVDDDGHRNIMTRLKPLAEKHGIPFTVCVPSDWVVGGTSGTTKTELMMLQDELGFEVASHAKTHNTINSVMPLDVQYAEIAQSWQDLTELGFDVDTIVYPYGQITEYGKRIVSQFYSSGVSTDARLNGTPSKNLLLGRIKFPGDTAEQQTLDYYKSKVDEAVATNSWLIWMLHVGFEAHTETQQQILDELIAYIKGLNVEIVTVRDGMKMAGNAFSINEEQFYIGNDGTTNIKDFSYEKANTQNGASAFTFNSLPNDFPLGKVIANTVGTTTGSPSGNRGLLITYVKENNQQDSYQIFISSRRTFERYSNADNTWTAWTRVFRGTETTTGLSASFGDVPSMSAVSKDILINGLAAGQYVVLTTTTNLPKGIMFSYSITGAWVLTVTMFNVTAAPITVGTIHFKSVVMGS